MSTVVKTDLSPRAQKILLAAQRVLARDGSEGLTLRAIAEEALETKSLVLYHFGSIANLEALLVDSLWHDIDSEFVGGLGQLPPATNLRVDALVRFHAGIAAVPHIYELYFDLLPSVIQNRAIRVNVARIYEAYREDIGDRCLEGSDLPPEEIRPLSSLLLAAGEGVPLQLLVGPPYFDGGAVFSLLAELVKARAGLPALSPEVFLTSIQSIENDPSGASMHNPGKGLAEPARRILKGAEGLVRTGGLRALTLDAIAQTSGEPRSSVSYYFDNKQGLIDALVDSVLYRCLRVYESLFEATAGDIPLPSPEETQKKLFGPTSPVLGFFLMLPAVLRDDGLREKVTAFYGSLHRAVAERMAASSSSRSSAQLLTFAGLTIASLDGLAIQKLYDPHGFSSESSLRILNSIITLGISER